MKPIIYLIIFVLLISSVYAVTLETNTKYNPSQSNVTYNITQTVYGITNITVNETCFTINLTNYCLIFNSTNILIFGINSLNINQFNLSGYSDSIVMNTDIPYFSSISENITKINYNYNSSQKNMSFDCTGSGDIIVKGLNNIDGVSGYVEVKHNGTHDTYTNLDTYTVSVCSNWQFLNNDYHYCGDGTCNSDEDSTSCSSDCGNPAGSGGSGSSGARGGGCNVLADYYEICYHIGNYGSCIRGCDVGEVCDENYRCELKEEEPVTKNPIKQIVENVVETIQEIDETIEEKIDKSLEDEITEKRRSDFQRLISYLYLRILKPFVKHFFKSSFIMFTIFCIIFGTLGYFVVRHFKENYKFKR